MASTTTYMQVVNEVLGSVGEGELSSSTFLSAKGKQRQAKRIVKRCLEDLVNNVPDEHWQKHEEILLYQPFDGGDGDTTGIDTIANDTMSTTGITDLTTTIGGGSEIWGAAGATTCQDCLIQVNSSASNLNPMDHAQWYRIKALAATTITTASDNLAALQNASLGAGLDPFIFTVVRFRVPLPSDFRDFVDADRPFGHQVDLQLTDQNGILRKIQAGQTSYTSEDPRYYAIGHDDDLVAGGSLGPFLYYWPFPVRDRYYRLHYQRQITQLDFESDTYDTTIDLPEDMISQLLYKSITMAKIDLANRPDEAGIYDRMASRKEQDAKEKTMTAAGHQQIRPDTDSYRSWFRRSRRGYGIQLLVDE